MGTEFTFSSYKTESAVELMPWFAGHDLRPEGQANAPAGPIVANPDGSESGNEWLPDVSANQRIPRPVQRQPHHEENSSSESGFEGDCQPANVSGQPQPVLGGCPQQEVPCMADDVYACYKDFVFPGSLRVPGFLHIAHGALSKVCQSLEGWEDIKEPLTHLGNLMHLHGPWDVYIETILVGPFAEKKVLVRGEKIMPSIHTLAVEVPRAVWKVVAASRARDQGQLELDQVHKRVVRAEGNGPRAGHLHQIER